MRKLRGLDARVGFIDDDEVRSRPQELEAMAVALDEVKAHNHVRMSLKQRLAETKSTLQAGRGGWQHEGGVYVELVAHLRLPLLREVRRRKDGDTFDLPTIHKLASDQKGFHGLADTDVVGDEEADGVQTQPHQERH